MSGIFMHRFLVSISLTKEITISPGELYHQIAHVFRARIGEKVMLFSECTDDVMYEILSISKK
jgi:16S rRNA U1498 N3-methylase RsmE